MGNFAETLNLGKCILPPPLAYTGNIRDRSQTLVRCKNKTNIAKIVHALPFPDLKNLKAPFCYENYGLTP